MKQEKYHSWIFFLFSNAKMIYFNSHYLYWIKNLASDKFYRDLENVGSITGGPTLVDFFDFLFVDKVDVLFVILLMLDLAASSA